MPLPASNSEKVQVSGRISVVQEQRFYLITDSGQGLLLTLSAKSAGSANDLHHYRQARTRVQVEYSGDPGMESAVAHSVSPV